MERLEYDNIFEAIADKDRAIIMKLESDLAIQERDLYDLKEEVNIIKQELLLTSCIAVNNQINIYKLYKAIEYLKLDIPGSAINCQLLLDRGYPREVIADCLNTSVREVKKYLKQITELKDKKQPIH